MGWSREHGAADESRTCCAHRILASSHTSKERESHFGSDQTTRSFFRSPHLWESADPPLPARRGCEHGSIKSHSPPPSTPRPGPRLQRIRQEIQTPELVQVDQWPASHTTDSVFSSVISMEPPVDVTQHHGFGHFDRMGVQETALRLSQSFVETRCTLEPRCSFLNGARSAPSTPVSGLGA